MKLLLLRISAFVFLLRVLRVSSRVDDLEAEMERYPRQRRGDLLWEVALHGNLPLPARGILILPSLYMMAPLDLMPDFLPFIGHADDKVVQTLALQLARFFASSESIAGEMRRLAPA